MTSERDGLKARLRKTELELEQIQTENQGFREERDRLRRRVGAILYLMNQRQPMVSTSSLFLDNFT